MSGRLSVVTDGMFGSCGKGHVTAWLTASENNDRPVSCVRPGAHQAGHTAIGLDGHAWALRQVPVAAVVNLEANLYIAAGSEVSPETLLDEVHRLDAAGFRVSSRLFVDSAATWLTQEHMDSESKDGMKTGSTKKGVGAARSARIWRKAKTIDKCPDLDFNWLRDDTGQELTAQVANGHHVVVEGVQGYGLGLHTMYYPNTTSGDCRAIDFLAQCGISPWSDGLPTPEIWVVVRPYPIRIAGESGPLKDETSWEALGLPEEITTVTKLRRRVGAWDPGLVRQAVIANGGNVKLAFSMADQVVPEIAGMSGPLDRGTPELAHWINKVEDAAGDNSRVEWVGTGPSSSLRRARIEPVKPVVPVGFHAWAVAKMNEWAPTIQQKSELYGTNSLREMGRLFARARGRNTFDVSDTEAVVIGCAVYAYGKQQRTMDAILGDSWPLDDSMVDAAVYNLMSLYATETGTWP